MAKKEIEFISERSMAGPVREHQPAVIRVRLYQGRGGEPQYRLDSFLFSVPVPAWMRHLDGVTMRGLVLALLALANALAAARWLLLARSGGDGA